MQLVLQRLNCTFFLIFREFLHQISIKQVKQTNLACNVVPKVKCDKTPATIDVDYGTKTLLCFTTIKVSESST